MALTGLGLNEEAVRAARRGVELLPIAREAWRGLYRIEELAEAAVMTGDSDTALAQLEILLSRPGEISAPMVKLDPRWAPLLADGRFNTLLAKYSAGP